MSNSEFQDFAKIWQQQSERVPPQRQPQNQKKSIWERIDEIQAKIRRENITVTIALVATTAFLGFIWYHYDAQQWLLTLGLSLIILGMMGSLYFFYQRTIGERTIDMGQPTQDYVSEVLKKLRYQRLIITRVMPVYAFLLILGLNLSYLEIIGAVSPGLRWTIHLLMTLVLIAVFLFSGRRHLRKYDAHYSPLIQQLEAILHDWEGPKA
jgi:membrane associated rhomboid family serine protease